MVHSRVEMVKRFVHLHCIVVHLRTFALHRQQLDKDQRNVDVALPWKDFCGRQFVHGLSR